MRRPANLRASLSIACALVGCVSDRPVFSGPAPASQVANAVASISVSPASAIGGLTTSIQYSAEVRNGNGDLIPSRPVTWASSDSTVVAVSNTGMAHSVGVGTAAITATAGEKSGYASATILLYPNQPAGYTAFAESDMSVLPWVSARTGTAAGGASPGSLETIVSGGGLPVTFPDGVALKHIIEAGTAAGDAEAGSDYAGFGLWNLGLPNSPTYGGPSDTEYSAFYLSTTFCIYGNGSTMELPGGSGEGGMKFPGYMGVTNNNQGPSGSGPTQLIMGIVGVGTTQSSPLTASEFTIAMHLQNGSASNWAQNLNLSKHIIVGQVHQLEVVATLGTNGGADGTWDAWIDGTKVMHYANVPFINSAYAADGGGTGLAGFWGWQFTPWWGGQGGPNKTRDDAIYLGHTYISGIFLRNPQ